VVQIHQVLETPQVPQDAGVHQIVVQPSMQPLQVWLCIEVFEICYNAILIFHFCGNRGDICSQKRLQAEFLY
jgi:hypothetical protein